MTITRILTHPVTLLVVTIMAIAFFFSLDRSSKKTLNSSQNIRVLEQEVNQISGEIIALEEKIANTQSQQFKEKVVRNELLLQKPGEYILQIANTTTAQTQQECGLNNCESNKPPQKSPAYAWKELLF